MRLSKADCQMLLKMIKTICDAIRTRLTGLINEVIESVPGRPAP